MSRRTPWTQDKVRTLARLWAEGLSARQLAARLGVSRNAVLGKVHRLRLAPRPGAGAGPARRKARPARPRPLRARPAPPPPAPPPGPPPERGLAAVATVGPRDCRWPLGDPRSDDFSLCGRPAARGAYCPAHAEQAYGPAARRPAPDHLLKLAGL